MKLLLSLKIKLLKRKLEKQLSETAMELRHVRTYGLFKAIQIKDRIKYYESQL